MRCLLAQLLIVLVSVASTTADQAPSTRPATLGDRISDRLGLPPADSAFVPAGNILTITSRSTPKRASAGGSVQLDIIVKIVEGWHINSHRPSIDFLVPTQLNLNLPVGVSLRRIDYPASIRKKFALSDDLLDLYEGDAVFKATLNVGPSAPPGDLPIRGRLDYQPCNDKACLAPATAAFQITLQVAGGLNSQETGRVTMILAPDSANHSPPSIEGAPVTEIALPENREKRSTWLFPTAGIVLGITLWIMLKRRS